MLHATQKKLKPQWTLDVIEDCSAKSLKSIFAIHIKIDAQVLAGGWTCYSSIKADLPNLKQTLSNKVKNLQILHFRIRNFKDCLRVVPSYCDKEYCFRFDRRNHRKSILDQIIEHCDDVSWNQN